MSPPRSLLGEQMWEIIRQERKHIAIVAVVMFPFPVLGAAFSGSLARTAVCALATAPGAVLLAAITMLSIRAKRGHFGPVVARRVLASWCAVLLLYLVALLGLVVRYMIYPNESPSLTALGCVAAALACVGMSILWRMYKSGCDTIARSDHL